MKIGLCLSGGGFRATLFHIGVVRELNNAGLLPDVKLICGVSGGSILAAHLAQEWKGYVAPLESGLFAKEASKVVNLTRRDVRGRATRAFVLSHLLRRRLNLTELLIREYDACLFERKLMSELNDGPRIEIISTNLRIPDAPCSFSQHCFNVWLPQNQRTYASGVTSVSTAVAASSAFPALFPPIYVDSRTLGIDPEKEVIGHYLTDGGVLDNTGARVLSEVLSQESLDLVIMSNAGARLDWLTEGKLDVNFKWFPRMVEILSEFASEIARRESEALIAASHKLVKIEIGAYVTGEGQEESLPEDAQRAAKRVRTDFDVFTPHEIRCLIWHGQVVGRKMLADVRAAQLQSQHYWDPMPKEPANWRSVNNAWSGLRYSDRRKLRPFSYDLASLLNAIALSLLIALLIALFGYLELKDRAIAAWKFSWLQRFPQVGEFVSDSFKEPRRLYAERHNLVTFLSVTDEKVVFEQHVTGILVNRYDAPVKVEFEFGARPGANLKSFALTFRGKTSVFDPREIRTLTEGDQRVWKVPLPDELRSLLPGETMETVVQWAVERGPTDHEEIVTSIPVLGDYSLELAYKEGTKDSLSVSVEKFVSDTSFDQKSMSRFVIRGPVFARQGFSLNWRPKNRRQE